MIAFSLLRMKAERTTTVPMLAIGRYPGVHGIVSIEVIGGVLAVRIEIKLRLTAYLLNIISGYHSAFLNSFRCMPNI